MMSTFTLVEPMIKGYIPPKPFSFYQDGAPIHEIVRIFMGTVDVFDIKTNTTIKLTLDESKLSRTRSCRPQRIVSLLFEGGIDVTDYEKFLLTTKSKNFSFFEKFRAELVLCMIMKKNKRNTEAFLYIYRLLEYMALAFPVLYSSVENDFSKSYNFLKSLLNSEKDGDLKALQTFIPILSKQGDMSELRFDFQFDDEIPQRIALMRSEFRRCIDPNIPGLEFDDDGMIICSVPFNSVPRLLVSVRNRLFHHRIGESNFDLVR